MLIEILMMFNFDDLNWLCNKLPESYVLMSCFGGGYEIKKLIHDSTLYFRIEYKARALFLWS